MNLIGRNKKLILFASICGLIVFTFIFKQKNTNFSGNISKASIIKNTEPVEILLGQNFIIGIPGPELDEATEKFLRDIKPGGVVLYRRNYESSEQFKSLISALQAIAREDGGVPYFIMIDEEPNGASRLDLLKDVFTMDLPDWGKIIQGIKTLQELGINVELAPVADFPFNEDSFIKNRVPANNPSDLMAFNKTFIQLLKDYNISATLKHFPGAGVFIEDPHETVPSAYVNENFFNQSFSLFESGISAGADFIMINHAIYENIDKENPATLSYPIVTGLLKNKLCFEGIIITDDIEDMLSLVSGINPIDAGVRALKAGNTMIMYSQNIQNTHRIFNDIKELAKKDQDLKNIIQKNYQEIIYFKEKNL